MGKIFIKNRNLFKNKTQMIIYILLFILFIFMFIYLGTRDYGSDTPDNIRFAKEFNKVSEDNVYTYVNVSDVYMIANGKKGIVLFGRPHNEWVNHYAKIVNEVAKEVGIEEIYYYDLLDDRTQNNGTYETLVNLLGNYVKYSDSGKADIFVPSLLVVANGDIIYFDDETSFVTGKNNPDLYWTRYQVGLKKNELRTVFGKYLEN